MNIVYRECSSIIMQYLTQNKYPPSNQILVGEQPQLEQLLVNNLIQPVMEPHLKEAIEKVVNEHARLLSQPRIKYGFNTRDPLKLLVYSTVDKCVQKELNGIISECIAHQRRQSSHHLDHEARNAVAPHGKSSRRNPQRKHRRRRGSPPLKSLLRSSRSPVYRSAAVFMDGGSDLGNSQRVQILKDIEYIKFTSPRNLIVRGITST